MWKQLCPSELFRWLREYHPHPVTKSLSLSVWDCERRWFFLPEAECAVRFPGMAEASCTQCAFADRTKPSNSMILLHMCVFYREIQIYRVCINKFVFLSNEHCFWQCFFLLFLDSTIMHASVLLLQKCPAASRGICLLSRGGCRPNMAQACLIVLS